MPWLTLNDTILAFDLLLAEAIGFAFAFADFTIPRCAQSLISFWIIRLLLLKLLSLFQTFDGSERTWFYVFDIQADIQSADAMGEITK